MKHTILIALLGATISLATPSLSFADNSYKFKNGSLDHNHSHKRNKNHTRNHKHDQKRFVAKPPKPHQIIKKIKRDLNKIRHHDKRVTKHNRRHDNKHGYNKQRHNNHNDYRNNYRQNHNYHNDNPTFSISWNVGNSTISYGNDRNYSAYNNGHNKSYNKGHRRNHGKRVYARIHKQAQRIQQGIHSGQLVRREVRKLRNEQRDIKQTLNHYKRDGRLNRREANQLHQLLDVASNRIHRKKHNHLTRHTRHHNQYVQF